MDRDGQDPEWRVRKRRIDPILDSLGWSRQAAVPAAGAARVEEYETASEPADHGIDDSEHCSVQPERVNPLNRSRAAFGSPQDAHSWPTAP